jgi:hypothetical protein
MLLLSAAAAAAGTSFEDEPAAAAAAVELLFSCITKLNSLELPLLLITPLLPLGCNPCCCCCS